MTASARSNWSGSHRYRGTFTRPADFEELRSILTESTGTVRALATRHTFTDQGDADTLIDLSAIANAGVTVVDREAMTATVGPAVTYAMLAEALHAHELAVENLASLPHISVIGAIATATHGSGDGRGNLATAVRGLELLTASGDYMRIDAGDPRLAGAAVHLGALGIIGRATLAVVPTYRLRQDVYLDLAWDALAEHFDAVMGAGRSVSVFHDFGACAREVWVKADAGAPTRGELFGARPASGPRNPVPGGSPEHCTAQLGVPGPWSERLPHFRSGYEPSAGEEIQSEWFVPRERAMAALAALREIAEVIRPVLRIAELRTIAEDELWLSPAHGRESAALHCTWRLEPARVRTACAEMERVLAPFQPRPHWGKLFTAPVPEYPRAGEWRALRREMDPDGRFVNPWLERAGLV